MSDAHHARPAAHAAPQVTPSTERSTWPERMKRSAVVAFRHATKFTGVGIVCAVAYFDPGNWGVDLQAGSQFGYKLLFTVLLSGIFAVYFQVLASRLGCVTGIDLATHCRLLLHSRPKHTKLWRWGALYPLYILSEAAIVCTDLAELLGSAIALCLLFPNLTLWAGVLITGADVMILLAMRNPLGGEPARLFEFLIAALVLTVLICMAVIISHASVHWGDAFLGFIPSHTLIESSALYTSIGILGATVMPHSLYLGSALGTQDRIELKKQAAKEEAAQLESIVSVTTTVANDEELCACGHLPASGIAGRLHACRHALTRGRCARAVIAHFANHFIFKGVKEVDEPHTHADRDNNPIWFVRAHLYHGIVDMVISLLGLAVVINALILILAAATFYSPDGADVPATLFDAYTLIRDRLGKSAAILFALALLASGQSSSIIATIAGQTVSEGFIRWRTSAVVRRLLTRSLGLIPSMLVAALLGVNGVSTLLVASQVALSIVLPFVVFPLVWLTSNKRIMSVRRGPRRRPTEAQQLPALGLTGTELQPAIPIAESEILTAQASTTSLSPRTPEPDKEKESTPAVRPDDVREEGDTDEWEDFSNGWIMTILGYLMFVVIVLANVYAIVTLGMGED